MTPREAAAARRRLTTEVTALLPFHTAQRDRAGQNRVLRLLDAIEKAEDMELERLGATIDGLVAQAAVLIPTGGTA